ncbi:UNVERIFIED_CONTAM: hypothetical protein Sangu_2511200 [Sesamum angustifolium]|uniref:Reverse transcriptase domain-containing protein n=1 Tax=Sesamum angustifolium TaxID=2727405 RepID=A0AAW2JMQ2_9LAMI
MVKRNATRNSILAITKADGSIITSVPDIAQEFVDFYTLLLGIEDQTRPVDDEVFHWGPSLTSELASNLYRAVTPAEVKTVIFQISDNKAPDPDSYTSCFFKKAWNIMGDFICRAVMDFFRSGRMLRQLNHTIIALVPKSEHSLSVANYRPISCCNVIYKVITKIIADCLSPALEQLIDSSQAAFVGGRNIIDNIFLAQEMVQQYSRKRISPHYTISVNLRKAFDSVSWTFLSRVLHGDVSGLAVNTAKSNIFKVGIQDDILDRVLAMTEFARGHMPVRPAGAYMLRYLGCGVLLAPSLPSSQWQLLKRSTVCAGPSYGIPREHQWPGRKFAIRRRKAVWVFGISNPGMLLSLPESYGTFIARQTPYGPSGSMRFTSGRPRFRTGSRRRATLHSFDDLPRSETGLSQTSVLQTQQSNIWKSGPIARDL